ncbi:MAG: ATP-binding protein [Patescibacteria group bacterium]
MKIIDRYIKKELKDKLFKGKVVIIYGPRQAGKTTFLKNFLQDFENTRYINCDIPENTDGLSPKSVTRLREFIGDYKLVVFDEAQRIFDIGRTLKILVDEYPEMQIIATGSSSFDLENKLAEPLTGRHYDFMMLPPMYSELISLYSDRTEIICSLENRLLYGSYPEIIFPKDGDKTRERIKSIAEDYSMKDILGFEGIRKSDTIMKLLKALAYQMGQEISYKEIAQNFGLSIQTIDRYIDILEKAFIVFRLQPYVNNKRISLRRTRKIYFWDTGLRNALINNFESLSLRPDKGALFENYIVAELRKKNFSYFSSQNFYFWRAYDGEEIDIILEKDGKITGYECKWKSDKDIIKKSSDAPVKEIEIITSENYMKFLG